MISIVEFAQTCFVTLETGLYGDDGRTLKEDFVHGRLNGRPRRELIVSKSDVLSEGLSRYNPVFLERLSDIYNRLRRLARFLATQA